jgi:2-hydroxychromene-2-carboxylate isomerase
MSKILDYYLTVDSPYTYLGSKRLAEIVARAGDDLVCHAVDFGQIFTATGGLPLPKRAPERRAYRLMELRRWRAHLGVEFTIEPEFFPVRAALANRMVAAVAEQGGDAFALSVALGRAVWVEERDVADAETLVAVAAERGFDGGALLAAAESDAIVARYQAETDAAIGRGIFGAPTYALGEELFWGQDRLDFLDRALAVAVA